MKENKKLIKHQFSWIVQLLDNNGKCLSGQMKHREINIQNENGFEIRENGNKEAQRIDERRAESS